MVAEIAELNNIDLNDDEVSVEAGEKLFRFWHVDQETNERKKLLAWFTTEKVLFDKSHGSSVVCGLKEFDKLTKYFLHYVGISKKDDSLTRLILKPHDKRLRILSNEIPMNEYSRITDEITHLFFRISPLGITTIESEEDIDSVIDNVEPENIPIICDAEKAYIKTLQPKYNAIKFKSYPKGKDGLYENGLNRYGYVLGENITLITATDQVKGGCTRQCELPPDADMIFVEGDNVTLEKLPC